MTIPGQIAYDMREPAEDRDDKELAHVETAMEMLEKAAKAYRADPPRMSTARGYVAEAIFKLRNIN